MRSTIQTAAKASARVPLRIILVVPFVVQIFAAVSLTGYLSLRNGQKAVDDLAFQLSTQVSDRVSQHLDKYLVLPHQINTINAKAIEQGFFDLNNLEELGKGSSFWFEVTLPIVDTHLEQLENKFDRIEGYTGARCKLLVVDDKRENRLVLLNMLEPLGFEITLAENGQQEVDIARQLLPDLILTDLVMPVKSGFEAVKEIRQIPEIAKIPIIAVSASVLDMDRHKSQMAGCEAFLSKPVDREKLLALLAQYLHLEWVYEEEAESNLARERKTELTLSELTKPIQQEELLARITIHLKIQALTQRLNQQNQLLQQQALELKAAKEVAEAANRELHRLANLDSLTQIANRRRFDEYLGQEWQTLAENEASLSLILTDIDYFKRYNDYYGHLAGDVCLKLVAGAIANILKHSTDLVARYGGEEFAIILPHTNAKGAIEVAKLIQLEVEKLAIPHLKSEVSDFITLSLGLSSCIPDRHLPAEFLVSVADRALYAAKEKGRNCYYVLSL